MKLAKKVLSIALCVAMLAIAAVVPFTASAETEPNWVNTKINTDGTVELSKNSASENNWPRVRTLTGIESAPMVDLSVANTLFFDFEATGCNWMIQFDLGGGLYCKLAKSITEAVGGTPLKNTDEDGAPGTYKGSLNILDAVSKIAADTADPNVAMFQTLAKNPKQICPGFSIYVVDQTTSGVIKMNSLFISSADDTTGAKCKQISLDLLYPEEEVDSIEGVRYFPLDMNNGAGGYDDAWEVEFTDGCGCQRWNQDVYDEVNGAIEEAVDEAIDEAIEEEAAAASKTTTTTKAAASTGMPGWLIPVIIVAIVVVVAVVVIVIVVSKKKKA